MATDASHGTCPHCGQTLLTEQAALHLQASDLEAQRTIAAQALAADLEQGLIARNEPQPGPEPTRHETEVDTATELHDVRLSVRQF